MLCNLETKISSQCRGKADEARLLLRTALLVFVCLLGHCALAAETTSSFRGLQGQSTIGGSVVPVSETELIQAETLFRRMFRGDRSIELKAAWQKLGFKCIDSTVQGKKITIIQELPEKKQGRGFFVFKHIKKGNLLEAPHALADLSTGEMAAELFFKHSFVAGAWSTVHQKKADMVQVYNSYFKAFSKAFSAEYPHAYIIQLHRLSHQKRYSLHGQDVSMILSNGTSFPSESLLSLASCIQKQVADKVLVYPRDMYELGATIKTPPTRIQQDINTHVIQIELSEKVRKQLLKSPVMLTKLGDCLPSS